MAGVLFLLFCYWFCCSNAAWLLVVRFVIVSAAERFVPFCALHPTHTYIHYNNIRLTEHRYLSSGLNWICLSVRTDSKQFYAISFFFFLVCVCYSICTTYPFCICEHFIFPIVWRPQRDGGGWRMVWLRDFVLASILLYEPAIVFQCRRIALLIPFRCDATVSKTKFKFNSLSPRQSKSEASD